MKEAKCNCLRQLLFVIRGRQEVDILGKTVWANLENPIKHIYYKVQTKCIKFQHNKMHTAQCLSHVQYWTMI